jgi:Fe2+ transport system protein B
LILRKVSSEEGMKLAKELKCPYVETCAKSNSNVEVVFSKLIQEIEGDIIVKPSSCLLS